MKFRGISYCRLFILTSCATLSKEECLRGDWRDLGMRMVSMRVCIQIEKHRKACAEHGIRPMKDYIWTPREGLREYCQIDNAFRSGLSGRKYQGVCPPPSIHYSCVTITWPTCLPDQGGNQKLHNEISSKQRSESNKTTDKERSTARRDPRTEKKLDELRDYLRDGEDLDDVRRRRDTGSAGEFPEARCIVEMRNGRQ